METFTAEGRIGSRIANLRAILSFGLDGRWQRSGLDSVHEDECERDDGDAQTSDELMTK